MPAGTAEAPENTTMALPGASSVPGAKTCRVCVVVGLSKARLSFTFQPLRSTVVVPELTTSTNSCA